MKLVGEELPGRGRADAALAPHEIQELTKRLAELEKLRAEAEVKVTYRLTIELEGEGAAEFASKMNEVLASVSIELKF